MANYTALALNVLFLLTLKITYINVTDVTSLKFIFKFFITFSLKNVIIYKFYDYHEASCIINPRNKIHTTLII